MVEPVGQGGRAARLWIDIGGTFTDAVLIDGAEVRQTKVLSLGRLGTEGGLDPRRLPPGMHSPVIAAHHLLGVPYDRPLPPLRVRLGTTRGTNALLTGQTAPVVLMITEGFADLPIIGDQRRPDLFALDIRRPPPVHDAVVELPGRIAADGREIVPLDTAAIEVRLRAVLQKARQIGRPITAAAVCCLHSVVDDSHEQAAAAIARRLGLRHVICSSAAAATPRLLARCQTALIDAALAPVLADYVDEIGRQFGPQTEIRWMTSAGGLVPGERLTGHDSVLSGPAGGAVALGQIAARAATAAVGLDMGGTSTDVCRCGFDAATGIAEVARRGESTIAGLSVVAPAMDIHTVAAGGGSICRIEAGRLRVGPDSAGADPGPACYGRGGPLTVTDLNVVLGRLPTGRFTMPIDAGAARRSLQIVAEAWNDTPERLAEGFLDIAVTQMAEAVRAVTTAAGIDVRQLALVGFGGSAGTHVCRIAEALQIRRVIDPPRGGVLSAVGIGAARPTVTQASAIAIDLSDQTLPTLTATAAMLTASLRDRVIGDADFANAPDASVEVQLRAGGAGGTLTLPLGDPETLAGRFADSHRRRFGFAPGTPRIEVVSVRATLRGRTSQPDDGAFAAPSGNDQPDQQATVTRTWIDGHWADVSVYPRESLTPDQTIDGPAIVLAADGCLMIEPGWQATATAGGAVEIVKRRAATMPAAGDAVNDAIAMELMVRRLQGIAESMGETIVRTSVSVNVKERRDFSCAIFRGDGTLLANAAHVPVHLGSMGHAVRSLLQTHPDMQPGDVFVTNDPYAGGSHLPDVTVITPVFVEDLPAGPDYFVASRCHHAEIGGITPGSMCPAATCLNDEGVVLRHVRLQSSDVDHRADIERRLLSADFPSRSPSENLADLDAARAAGRDGAGRLVEMIAELGCGNVRRWVDRWIDVSAQSLDRWIESLGAEPRVGTDQLDDGTPISVKLTARDGQLDVDFTGTGGVHPHGFNATPGIVTAAVMYVARLASGTDLPMCDGVLRRLSITIPPGLLDPAAAVGRDVVDAQKLPAVVAGNVETSQRIVDVLIGALGIAAGSQGTMNNLLIGDDSFGYYETIGGGAGATAAGPGADGVHTHMTNTAITDPEVLESRLPVRLWRFSLRRGSGGTGRHRGGDGLIRELEFLRPVTVSMIASRRTTRPPGIDGGAAGAPGAATWVQGDVVTDLPGCFTRTASPGDRLIVQTPGGGGWGA